MKRLEFGLSRVLEFRRQQAGAERSRLQVLFNQLHATQQERTRLRNQLAESRHEAVGSGTVSGDDLAALCEFTRYVENRTAQLDKDQRSLSVRIQEQQLVVVAADRRVTLLEKLKGRQAAAWFVEQEKELEALAADSFMAKLAAARRAANAGRGHLEGHSEVCIESTSTSNNATDLIRGVGGW
jgi:flagellar biosynthesis chaperone FliJ